MSRHSTGYAGGLDMTQEETTSTDGAMFITTPPLCSVSSWCNVQETTKITIESVSFVNVSTVHHYIPKFVCFIITFKKLVYNYPN